MQWYKAIHATCNGIFADRPAYHSLGDTHTEQLHEAALMIQNENRTAIRAVILAFHSEIDITPRYSTHIEPLVISSLYGICPKTISRYKQLHRQAIGWNQHHVGDGLRGHSTVVYQLPSFSCTSVIDIIIYLGY